MRGFSLLLLISLAILSGHGSPAFGSLSAGEFSGYVHGYSSPQLFENNGAAFTARLKLLDMAPKGARIRIATFEFLNGKSTRLLSRHLCLAARRGVQVELLVDSKMGDRPGLPDPFDQSEDSQVVEELFQYLANCGVEVIIYNHLESYVEVMGQRIPNVLLNPARDGQSVNLIEFFFKSNELVSHIAHVANEELYRVGIRADVSPLLSTAKSMAFELLNLHSITKSATSESYPPLTYEISVHRLEWLYLQLVRDQAWYYAPPEKLKLALGHFLARLQNDPYLRALYTEIRRFNRIQHRKLFIVESKNGREACMVLGGRNIGDQYLLDGKDAFLDADVLLCRHHSAEANRAINEGLASFEDLKKDRSDPMLHKSNDLKLRRIGPQPDYPFANLLFPAHLAPKGLRLATYQGSLPAANRILLSERSWNDSAPIQGNISLHQARNWRVLRSGWRPDNDEVRRELITRVRQESNQIYLETAYAEFNSELRDAIEKALQRGVKVQIVTNSFFVTDGLSKIIRVLMANWVHTMRARYPRSFQVLLTSYEAGHMTHLKNAAFACQPSEHGEARVYLLGSHNFQPRSGRSDKENSLVWEEPSDCQGLSSSGITHSRAFYYRDISRRLRSQVLVDYPDLYAELASAMQTPQRRREPSTRLFSRALRRIFYIEGERGQQLKEERRVDFILRLMDRGGLHDLIGLLL